MNKTPHSKKNVNLWSVVLVTIVLITSLLFKFGELKRYQNSNSQTNSNNLIQDSSSESRLSEKSQENHSNFQIETNSSTINTTTSIESSQDDTTSTNESEENLLNECFERLNRQLDPENFFVKNQNQLSEKLYPWMLNKDSIGKPFKTIEAQGQQLDYPNRILKALYLLGWLDGSGLAIVKNVKEIKNQENLSQALAELKAATLLQPKNSVAWIYLGLIYQQLENKELLQKALTQIKESQYFKTGLNEYVRYLYLKTNQASDFIYVVGIVSAMPIPRYNLIRQFAIDHQLGLIGQQMIKSNDLSDNILQNQLIIEFVDFVLIEYAIGISILNSLNIKHQYRSTKQYIQLTQENLKKFDFWNNQELVHNCDLKTVEKHRLQLVNYLQKKD